MELDSNLAEAHISLGYSALVYRRDFPEAERQFQSAMRLRPQYPPAHHFSAYYLTGMCRIGEAGEWRDGTSGFRPALATFKARLRAGVDPQPQFQLGLER